jgi:hypothetical protein
MLTMQKLLILTSLLILITATNVQGSWPPEAGELSYQIDKSDRIAAGNVTDIQEYPEYSVVIIKVDEWLMEPLPSAEIEVITEIGSTYINNNEPRFYKGESVILMLQDINVTENRFEVTIGEPGKHPVTDRDEIISELESMKEPDNALPFIESYVLILVFVCVVFMLRRS